MLKNCRRLKRCIEMSLTETECVDTVCSEINFGFLNTAFSALGERCFFTPLGQLSTGHSCVKR
jgi:hypothetical protein